MRRFGAAAYILQLKLTEQPTGAGKLANWRGKP
jgi:hypothetical protein